MNEDHRYVQIVALRETHPEAAQQALDRLANIHRAQIQRFLAARFHGTLSMEDIEDLAQLVFLKVWEDAGSFRGHGTVRAWLFGIAIRMAIDMVRKRERRTQLLERHPLESPEQEDAETQVLREAEQQEVRLNMRKLPAVYRRVLRLRYQSELSYESIARRLQLSIGTVKSRLHRAKEELSKLLQDP